MRKLSILVVVTAALAVLTGVITTQATTQAAPADDTQEAAFLVLLNNYRAQNGLGPVAIDSKLQAAAEWHSTDMGQKNYFNHTDSLGRNPFQRMCDFGYCQAAARSENIAAGQTSADAVFSAWRNSPGHNATMLNASMKAIGIARVHTSGSTYGYYWTNDFGSTLTVAPTAAPTPKPTPKPTVAPPPSGSMSQQWGDVDCDGHFTSRDKQALSRRLLQQPDMSANEPCPYVGEPMRVDGSRTIAWGDVDCDGAISARDAQALLRKVLGNWPLTQAEPCPDIGDTVSLNS